MSAQSEDLYLALRKRRWRVTVGALGGLLLVSCLLALASGSVAIPVREVARILLHRLPGVGPPPPAAWPASHEQIVLAVRSPRVALAAAVGATLGLAGAALQGLLRNPMADPYVIGVSSGAALGATLAMTLGLGKGLGLGMVPAAAFLGALASIAMVYTLARTGGRLPVLNLLLAGVAVGSFLSALVSALLVFAHRDVRPVIFWLMGGLGGRGWFHLAAASPYMLLGAGGILLLARELNALLLGEESARQLGVDTERVKLWLVAAAALATAAAVAVAGIIGFVGLVVPHMARLVVGADHRILLPAAGLGGAALLVLADTAARVALAPGEIPVGIITSLIGGPFFLYLLRRARTRFW